MRSLVVLVALVAIATAGVVVPNRAYGGYPAGAAYGGRDGYGYGYNPNYANQPTAVYAPAVAVKKAAVYGNPYNNNNNNYGYGYQPAAAYPAANYDSYNYRPAAVVAPVKKAVVAVDPYPYFSDYQNSHPFQSRANSFPAKAVVPVRKDVFPARSIFPTGKSAVVADPYAYQPSFGAKNVVYPAAPVRKVADPYAYQPVSFGVKNRAVADPFPARGVFPARSFPQQARKAVVDPYAYPARKVVNAYPAYPAKRVAVVDPYYAKPAYPAVQKVVGPRSAYPYNANRVSPYYRDARPVVAPVKAAVVKPVQVSKAAVVKKSPFANFGGFADLGKDFGGKGFGGGFGKNTFPEFKF